MSDVRSVAAQHEQQSAVSASSEKVLRNTYALLAMTLVWSSITGFYAMATNAQPVGFVMLLVGFYGLLFLTHYLANSAWGLLSVFALTGFMGYTLGPILSFYLAMPGGESIVTTAFGMTAMVFLGLSAFVLTTRKDFSFLSNFMFAGFIVLICAMFASFFLNIPALSLAVSAGFVMFSSAAILYQTSAIIHGGERNYILATITLYVSIYNILMSLMHILGALSGDD